MPTLTFAPYSIIEEKRYFGDVVLRIDKEDFADSIFNGNLSIFHFKFCFFERLSIVNESSIAFDKSLIAFTACFINNLEIEEITSDKYQKYSCSKRSIPWQILIDPQGNKIWSSEDDKNTLDDVLSRDMHAR